MAVTSNVFLRDTELQVGETAGSVTEHVIRTGSLTDPVTITYGITGDTATAGQDFVGGGGTVTMAAGVSDVSIPVQILDDTVAEPTEVAVLSLIEVRGATLWAPRTSRISILDNETPAPPPPPEPPLVSNYNVSLVPVVTGLDQPIKFVFSPLNSSTAYIAEKSGIIEVADIKTGTTKVMLNIQNEVNDYGDHGLMGIALHPDFANNPYIYAFAVIDPPDTAGKTGNAGPDGGGNRYAQVLRYTADAATGFTTIVPGSRVVLEGAAGQSLNDINGHGQTDFTDPALAGETASDQYIDPARPAPTVVNGFKQDYLKDDSASHIGGAMAFGPDGDLYVSVGDGTSYNFADPRAPNVQSLDSFSGKILRIDPMTGQGLADNPFVLPDTSLSSNRAKVYQLGFRNPFSITFDAEGRLFVANTGWNSWEAINMGGPGANFGWPYYEGGDGGVSLKAPSYRDFASAQTFYAGVANGSTQITPAFRAFSHDSADPGYQVQAITGGAVVYTGSVYPAEFKSDYFFSDFSGGKILTVDANDRSSLKFLYQGGSSNVPVDYVQGPDGYVYYSNVGTGEIGRMLITALPPPLPPGGATIGSGPDTLVLSISQDAYAGNALYSIRVDGTQIGGYLTALAAHGSGKSDTVSVLGDWAKGNHTVTVNFLNDAFGNTAGTDRNLYVDGAVYDGGTIAGAARSLLSSGPVDIGFIDSATTLPPTSVGTTIGTGSNKLVLDISQDAYAGPAQYTVSVDGVAIGGTLTAAALHGSGVSDIVNVLGDWANGTHSVAVNFLNDVYRGTPDTDRNLYVDGAAYNGATVAGAAHVLLSGGPVAIAFGSGTSSPAGTTIGSGSYTLALKISQDAYNGPAQYTVSVDGVAIGGTLTATALHGSGKSDAVNVLGNWAPGSHTATINFLNDAWGGSPATDRNLCLDSAAVDGTTVPGAALTLIVPGPQNFSFLSGTATTPPTTIGSGPDTLVLHISQDAYNGSAQYAISVDGVAIGGTLTAAALHSSGQSDTINVLGTWATGNHTATVNFLNDLYAGTASTDRNLFVDSAAFKGAAVPNSSLTLLSAGPMDISFVR